MTVARARRRLLPRRLLDATQLRLRYAPHAREWRIWLAGASPSAWSFDDEEEKVLEFLEDALRATLPWVGAASVADED
jgi:hypothetical protein